MEVERDMTRVVRFITSWAMRFGKAIVQKMVLSRARWVARWCLIKGLTGRMTRCAGADRIFGPANPINTSSVNRH